MTLSLPFLSGRSEAVEGALEVLASEGEQARGAVYTRPEVVSGLLDLCGYTPDVALESLRLLEPACGTGLFVLEALERLLGSLRGRGLEPARCVEPLHGALLAVEVHRPTWERARAALVKRLLEEGFTALTAASLVRSWLRRDDFLLAELSPGFDVIVGNPPYVRQERIADALLQEYKRRYATLYDRADLYVPFFERCLDLLGPRGALGFICANRWVKNKYGGPLREKIARGYHLEVYLDLEQVSAFEAEVDAYPAVTVIRPGADRGTRVLAGGGGQGLREVFSCLDASRSAPFVRVVRGIARGRDPWLVEAPEVIHALRALEEACPTLEEAGAKVGIGGRDGL